MQNDWENFLSGIETLMDQLLSSVRHEEKVMKYEMAIQKSANEKLAKEVTTYKTFNTFMRCFSRLLMHS